MSGKARKQESASSAAALSSGKTSKDITSALTHVFATGNQNTDRANAALNSAKAAGERISEAAGKKGLDDETKIKTGGLTEAINDFITARKTAGIETGDTSATAGLGVLSKDELITAAKMGRQMDLKDSEDAQAKLEELEKQSLADPRWNDDKYSGLRERLTTLRAWKKSGILQDNQAIKLAQRGGADALSAATIQAAAGANYKKAYDAQQTEVTDALGKDLNNLSALTGTDAGRAAGAQYLNNYYTDKSGKVDLTKMLKDKSKGVGAFSDTEGWGKEYWENDGRQASDLLNRAQQGITNAATRSGVLNATSPELNSKADLGEAIDRLAKVLDGGTLGKGLELLIGAINNF